MMVSAAETGMVAADRMRAGGQRRVVAVFRHSAYLEGGVCLAAPGLPMGPLVARLAALPALRVGDPVELEPGPIWTSPACACTDPGGLRSVVLGVLRRSDWDAWFAAWPSRAAAAELLALARRLPVSAQAMVGLGPGLTPAGDDVLAGYALASRALGHGVPAIDLRGTGDISRALLACALDGSAAEDEGELIRQPSWAAARRVAGHGATSGIATLLGILRAAGG